MPETQLIEQPIVLGIDPGYARVGFGLIQGNTALDYGLITTSKKDRFPLRLATMWNDIRELVTASKPDIIALEYPFFGRNITTQGGILQALGTIRHCLEVLEFPADKIVFYHQSTVKATIANYGAAQKADIVTAVTNIFNLDAPPHPDDAADGLAIAYLVELGIPPANIKS